MDWARRILYRQSLRGWMALALVLAVLPLLTSAVVGYAVYHRTIVSPFRDVLTVQHATLVSLERIHDDYWQVAEAVNGYLLSGEAERAARYAAVAAEVEAQFERLAEAVADDPALVALIGVARAEWAPELADGQEGAAGIPPVLLSLRDGREGYDVTTPATVFATWNVLSQGRGAMATLGAFRAIAR
ncbi:hypothetical protein LZ190_22455, partial [Rhodovulum sulfidophilum]|nr:hypothetical protein [Rhodovulum sulfidophilum]